MMLLDMGIDQEFGSAQGDQDITGDAVVTATTAIPAGAEITISYIETAQPLQDRQVVLNHMCHEQSATPLLLSCDYT